MNNLQTPRKCTAGAGGGGRLMKAGRETLVSKHKFDERKVLLKLQMVSTTGAIRTANFDCTQCVIIHF